MAITKHGTVISFDMAQRIGSKVETVVHPDGSVLQVNPSVVVTRTDKAERELPRLGDLGFGNRRTELSPLPFAKALKLVQGKQHFRCSLTVGHAPDAHTPYTHFDMDPYAPDAVKKAIAAAKQTIASGQAQYAKVVAECYHVFDPQHQRAYWQIAELEQAGTNSNPRAPKGTPTSTNIYALAKLFGELDRVPNRVSPTSAPHIRRTLKAGLVRVEGSELVLTPEGRAAVDAYRHKYSTTMASNPSRRSRRADRRRPVTKPGQHGTLYLHEIVYAGEEDPKTELGHVRLWGYDREHAIDKFYEGEPDAGWQALRIARVLENDSIKSRWNWHTV